MSTRALYTTVVFVDPAAASSVSHGVTGSTNDSHARQWDALAGQPIYGILEDSNGPGATRGLRLVTSSTP